MPMSTLSSASVPSLGLWVHWPPQSPACWRGWPGVWKAPATGSSEPWGQLELSQADNVVVATAPLPVGHVQQVSLVRWRHLIRCGVMCSNQVSLLIYPSHTGNLWKVLHDFRITLNGIYQHHTFIQGCVHAIGWRLNHTICNEIHKPTYS